MKKNYSKLFENSSDVVNNTGGFFYFETPGVTASLLCLYYLCSNQYCRHCRVSCPMYYLSVVYLFEVILPSPDDCRFVKFVII